MKDIFIDSNVAKNFANPVDINYKALIQWIQNYNEEDVANNPENKLNYAHLVVNQKLLVEYLRTSYNCANSTAMPTIISLLTRQGRLIKLDNSLLQQVKEEYFTKSIQRNILSNSEDHCHICSIIESNRKMVITYDVNLSNDLKLFRRFAFLVSDRPENLNYK